MARAYKIEPPTLWQPVDPLTGAELHRTPRPPKPAILTGRGQWAAFVGRLSKAGMVRFSVAPRAVCGAFAVAKPDGSQRFIVDARPANWHFANSPHVSLPTPDVIGRVRMPYGPVYVAKSDVSDFYHAFRLPEWLSDYFGLPPLPAASISPGVAAQYGASTRVYPCCTTLPMGYSHAVVLAQAAHERVLDSLGDLFPRADRIGDPACTDYTLRRGRVMHAVYIDDLVLFGTNPGELLRRQTAYVTEMRRRGFAFKPAKLVRPTLAPTPVLGMEFDGVKRTLRSAPNRSVELVRETRAVLAVAGRVSGQRVAELVGSWLWAMLPCRPSLSIFAATFAFVEKSRRRGMVLWPTVRRELTTALCLLPLLIADLSVGDLRVVVATDASDTGLGVTAYRLDGYCDNTHSNPARDQPLKTFEFSLANLAVERVPWQNVVAFRWRRAEHINVLEMRAFHVGLRWVLKHRSAVGCRLLFLCDSAVACGVIRKGRSSSVTLLQRMRAIAADLIRAGCVVDIRWIPSELNPADAPSRAFSYP